MIGAGIDKERMTPQRENFVPHYSDKC